MGFLRVNVDSNHYCSVPRDNRLMIGTTWQCDECGQVWQVQSPRWYESNGVPGDRVWKRIRLKS